MPPLVSRASLVSIPSYDHAPRLLAAKDVSAPNPRVKTKCALYDDGLAFDHRGACLIDSFVVNSDTFNHGDVEPLRLQVLYIALFVACASLP